MQYPLKYFLLFLLVKGKKRKKGCVPVSGTCFYPTGPNLSCCSYCAARQVHLHWKAQQGGGRAGMCDTPTSYPLLPFGWPPPRKKENVISCACPFAYCFFLPPNFFVFSSLWWRGREEAGIIWGFAWCWSRGVARVAHDGRDFFVFRLVRVSGLFSSPVKSTRRDTHIHGRYRSKRAAMCAPIPPALILSWMNSLNTFRHLPETLIIIFPGDIKRVWLSFCCCCRSIPKSGGSGGQRSLPWPLNDVTNITLHDAPIRTGTKKSVGICQK